MLYTLTKKLLFRMNPEDAHHLILKIASLNPNLGKITGIKNSPKILTKVGNCLWGSPIGLAAGLDKNAEALNFFENQGFGAIECGTVTLRAQDGNPRPRIWRYPNEESLRNAMGFPNAGLATILKHLQACSLNVPLGVNIGKNKESSAEESIEELVLLLETLKDVTDYFAINVSSPNTPGLRALQEKGYLTELFDELNKVRNGKDLYLKIAPDLDHEKIKEVTELVLDKNLTGIIATNTTIIPERGTGGVSGKLLTEKAKEVRSLILSLNPRMELIGVGGISSAKDIFDFWKQGGKAVQIYTSYIYQGPKMLKDIQKSILLMMEKNGIKNLDDYFKLNPKERASLFYPA